ncbi:MAG: glycosyltransferase family 2 protein [Candidatus Aminicenantes bacterium]|nr:glycosyltransferase family 2 protein [Candidatus Aminicenantes bacterium]
MRPIVSIITPTYNHEKYIGQCIESVLAQTFHDWEMIIIDDSSTDKTAWIIEEYARKDERIRLVRHTENWGIYRLAETYNQALELSKGKYLAILEGDDFWPPQKLKKQLKAFENYNVHFCWGKVAMVDERGEILGIIPTRKLKDNVSRNRPPGNILKILLYKDIIPAVGVLIKKESITSIGGFVQRNYLPFVDYPTWLLLSLMGEFYFERDIVGYWRRHESQATTIFGEEQEKASAIFVSEFIEKIPLSIKNELKLSFEKIIKLQKYRAAYPYFSLGRIYLSKKQWKKARENFKIAIRKGSLRTKCLSTGGIILTYFKIALRK